MPTVHAYAITGDFDQSIKYAIAHYTTRHGRLPAAIWLHPSRIPPDWHGDRRSNYSRSDQGFCYRPRLHHRCRQ